MSASAVERERGPETIFAELSLQSSPFGSTLMHCIPSISLETQEYRSNLSASLKPSQEKTKKIVKKRLELENLIKILK